MRHTQALLISNRLSTARHAASTVFVMGAVATNASCGSFNDNDSNVNIITFWELPFVNCRDTPQAIPDYPLSNFYPTAVRIFAYRPYLFSSEFFTM
jgi:hypothetical protein